MREPIEFHVALVSFAERREMIMAISSFTKDFTLNSIKAVDSFEKIISTPKESIRIDRTLVSPEDEKRSELKLKQMLSR